MLGSFLVVLVTLVVCSSTLVSSLVCMVVLVVSFLMEMEEKTDYW